MSDKNINLANKKEACRTYIEQTKHLTTLASAFLIPPVAIFGFMERVNIIFFLISEISFVISVGVSYIVLGSITGTQDAGEYNVYRRATRFFSLIQFGTYVLGLIFFFLMVFI